MPRYKVEQRELAAQLARLRDKADWSLGAAARVGGLSKAFLWSIEGGAVNVSVKTLVQLANAYQIPPSELLFLVEEEIVE